MPWTSIIVWLITFALSMSKKGTSAGKAALLATGAAVGTYVLADPSNADNLLGVGAGSATTDNAAGAVTGSGKAAPGTSAGWAGVANTALTTAGKVATDPNTAKTIIAGAAATRTGIFSGTTGRWIACGVLLLLLRKKKT